MSYKLVLLCSRKHTVVIPKHGADAAPPDKINRRAHDCNHLRQVNSVIENPVTIFALEQRSAANYIPSLE
jgi:hypothetical protein